MRSPTPSPALPQALVLAGPPGVGKTSVGRAVAAARGGHAVDLDALVSRRAGRTPAELIRGEGEAALRREEAAALAELPPEGVIALGGGTLTTFAGRAAARAAGLVVGLSASPETLQARLQSSGDERPLLAEGLSTLLTRRRRAYASVDKQVDAEGPVEAVASRVLAEAEGVHRLEARVGDAVTRVLVGRGLGAAVAGAIAHLEPTRPVLALLDAGVPEATRRRLLAPVEALFDVVTRVVPGGEVVKTWAVAGEVLDAALAAGCGRQSVVLAVGGGATCDLAGLVAHLLGRGAALVLAPTTLLAQVDASVGGKCAVNMAAGRNLVGAFHPATDVVADLDTLTSLSPAEHRSGLAELLKMGVIGDAALFARVAAGAPVGPAEVARAVALKAAIVAQDPFEGGLRRVLNLGHTLGHALETASGHQLRHGEAVAIGMAAVARLSAARGWARGEDAQEIVDGLARVGLPTSAHPSLLSAAGDFIGADKKSAAGQVALVAIERLASVVVQTLSLDEVREGLLRYGGDR